MISTHLTPQLASHWARLALGHVEREYPVWTGHVHYSAADARKTQRELHPIFYGSFDWHSCVHGHWLLARVLMQYPKLPESSEILKLFERNFTAEKVAVELSYFHQPGRGAWERPYGWAWLLKLVRELDQLDLPYAATLAPLANHLANSLEAFLQKSPYPNRVGMHANSAFAMILGLDYAMNLESRSLEETIHARGRAWFGLEVDYRVREPDGSDFLSPALTMALLMQRLLPADEFNSWFSGFLPEIPASLLTPAIVVDRTDGQIAHLDGLNLSRAWCWRQLARSMPTKAQRDQAQNAATTHLQAALPHLGDDYAGEHWLATFAMLAME